MFQLCGIQKQERTKQTYGNYINYNKNSFYRTFIVVSKIWGEYMYVLTVAIEICAV